MYITIADVRAEGLESATAYPDALITNRIKLAQQYIERRTRQWFEPRTLTLLLNGHDGRILHLGVPIIELTALYINGDFATPVDPSRYTVHNGRVYPDDRRNPRVSLHVPEERDIYRANWLDAPPRFRKGSANQKLVGRFGYVEDDDSTPELIKRAALKLVLMSVGKLAPNGTPPAPRRVIQSEATDGHSVAYGVGGAGGSGTSAYHGDDEVEAIMHQYRAPLSVAVTGSDSIEMG